MLKDSRSAFAVNTRMTSWRTLLLVKATRKTTYILASFERTSLWKHDKKNLQKMVTNINKAFKFPATQHLQRHHWWGTKMNSCNQTQWQALLESRNCIYQLQSSARKVGPSLHFSVPLIFYFNCLKFGLIFPWLLFWYGCLLDGPMVSWMMIIPLQSRTNLLTLMKQRTAPTSQTTIIIISACND